MLHVSRLLWLIVALGALPVKSTRSGARSFDKQHNSLRTKGFLSFAPMEMFPAERDADPVITAVRCDAIPDSFSGGASGRGHRCVILVRPKRMLVAS